MQICLCCFTGLGEAESISLDWQTQAKGNTIQVRVSQGERHNFVIVMLLDDQVERRGVPLYKSDLGKEGEYEWDEFARSALD